MVSGVISALCLLQLPSLAVALSPLRLTLPYTVLNSIAPIRETRPNGLCFAALQVHAVQNRSFSSSLRSEKYIAYAIYFSERYYLYRLSSGGTHCLTSQTNNP